MIYVPQAYTIYVWPCTHTIHVYGRVHTQSMYMAVYTQIYVPPCTHTTHVYGRVHTQSMYLLYTHNLCITVHRVRTNETCLFHKHTQSMYGCVQKGWPEFSLQQWWATVFLPWATRILMISFMGHREWSTYINELATTDQQIYWHTVSLPWQDQTKWLCRFYRPTDQAFTSWPTDQALTSWPTDQALSLLTRHWPPGRQAQVVMVRRLTRSQESRIKSEIICTLTYSSASHLYHSFPNSTTDRMFFRGWNALCVLQSSDVSMCLDPTHETSAITYTLYHMLEFQQWPTLSSTWNVHHTCPIACDDIRCQVENVHHL